MGGRGKGGRDRGKEMEGGGRREQDRGSSGSYILVHGKKTWFLNEISNLLAYSLVYVPVSSNCNSAQSKARPLLLSCRE